MDKRQLTEIISEVYKPLTPKKVSIFLKNSDLINIRVVSESFAGMIFSDRFKRLNKMLKEQQAELFTKYIYVFEAFTPTEVSRLPKTDEIHDGDELFDSHKQSARPLES